MQIKTLARVIVAAPLAGALLAGQSAQAAGPYTFTAGAAAADASAARESFVKTGCNPAGVGASFNGVDGKIVEVSSTLSNRDIRFTWSAQANVGWVTTRFYTAACLPTNAPNPSRLEPGTTTIRVASAARWMIVEGVGNGLVTFSYAA